MGPESIVWCPGSKRNFRGTGTRPCDPRPSDPKDLHTPQKWSQRLWAQENPTYPGWPLTAPLVSNLGGRGQLPPGTAAPPRSGCREVGPTVVWGLPSQAPSGPLIPPAPLSPGPPPSPGHPARNHLRPFTPTQGKPPSIHTNTWITDFLGASAGRSWRTLCGGPRGLRLGRRRVPGPRVTLVGFCFPHPYPRAGLEKVTLPQSSSSNSSPDLPAWHKGEGSQAAPTLLHGGSRLRDTGIVRLM